ncbi:hypothetical protein JCM6882_007092 [Rhodosporidiobolus microsporus]
MSTPPRSSSPSTSLRSKRPLSSPAPSTAPLKRANSEDTQMLASASPPKDRDGHESADEGSIGASRLNIASTPRSLSAASDDGQDGGEGDTTLQPPPSDDPPAYASADEAEQASSFSAAASDDDDDDDELPSFGEARSGGYNGPAGENQLSVILDLKRQPLEEGDEWYLISRQWFRRWQVACSGHAESKEDAEMEGLSPEEVGPVDNSTILEEGPDGVESLRKNPPVMDGVDLELLPAPAWRYLVDWYGLTSPAHSIPRTVLASSGPGSEALEFYPPTFQLFLLLPSSTTTSSSPVSVPTLPHAPSTSLPSSAAFSQLLTFARTSFSLPSSTSLRLWRLPPAADALSASEGPAFVLSDKLRETGVELLQFGAGAGDDISLADALLSDPETRIAVEVQGANGAWVVDAEEVTRALGALEASPSPAEAAEPAVAAAAGAAPEKDDKKEKKHHKGLFSNGWSSSLGHHSSKKEKKEEDKEKKDEKEKGAGGILGAAMGALTRSKTLGHRQGGEGGRTRGLVGLQNLGNTCFMNSAIQCMSNTKELQEYFLSGVYKSELNPSNPLGMRGQVASAFGELIERLWHGTSSSVAPREFKQALAKFAPQFSGYGQQDSQELLAFLLDGTHEDLNRILKKPATEAPDWEGGGDKELVEMARTCWEQYRARNDSVIVNLFQGQYRSTVVCPDCDKVSITFDPFMYVTTNLPVVKKWEGRVFVVPLDPARKVLAVDCEVPKSGTIKTLKGAVGKLVDIDPKRLIVTEEFHNKFWKEWHDDEAVTDIQRNDRVIFYETTHAHPQPRPRDGGYGGGGFGSFSSFGRKASPAPPAKPIDPDAPVHIVVVHRKPESASSSSSRPVFGTRPSEGGELFGSPFVVTLSAEEAKSEAGIKRAIVRQYVRVTKRGDELREVVEGEIEDREEEERIQEIEEQQQEQQQQPAPEAPVPMDVDSAVLAAPTPAASNGEEAAPAPAAGSIDPSLLDAASASSSSLSTALSSASTSAEPSTQNSTTSSAAPSARPASPSPSAPAAELNADAAPPATTTTTPPRRRAAYRLEVVKRPANNGRPFLKQSDYSDPTEPLERKAKVVRRMAKEMAAKKAAAPAEEEKRPEEEDVDMFSPTVKRGEDDAAPAPVEEKGKQPETEATPPVVAAAPVAPAAAAEPPKPLPLVKTGHYLVAHWDAPAYEYFFGADVSAWEEVEEVVDPSLAAKRSAGKGQKKAITLADCLVEFTKEERLGEDDQWYCSRCSEHKQATKKVELWKVPDVLVFALKRFSSSRYSRDKVDDFVDSPFELDMAPFVEGDRVEQRLAQALATEGGDVPPSIEEPDSLTYDLYAVSNHFGGLGGGHYTAFAKNPDNGKWYDFDDSRVTEISPDRVRSPAAYLLFYRRRTARPIGGHATRDLVESANASRAASAAPSLAASVVGLGSPALGGGGGGGAESEDEAPLPGAFSGTSSSAAAANAAASSSSSHSHSTGDASQRFAGMFPLPPLGSSSPPSSAEPDPGSPKDMSAFADGDDEWAQIPPPEPESQQQHQDDDALLPPPLVTAEGVPAPEDRTGQVEEFVSGAGGEKEGEVEEIRVEGQ